MRGHFYNPEQRFNIRLIGAVNLFLFPPGLQAPTTANKLWALGAITNFDMSYRLGSCRGKWIKRPRNSLHLYAPGCRYQTDNPIHDGELTSSWLTFEADKDIPLLEKCNEQHFAQFLDPEHRVINLVNQCADACEQHKDSGYFVAHSVLLQIIDRLMRAVPNEDGTYAINKRLRKPKTDQLVSKVHQYIIDHMDEVIRLEDIAAFCHISVSSLSHRYRELTGKSPLQTQTFARMDRAKQMLLVGESASDIAEQLGYSDVYHFSKAFKKHVGCPPRKFIQQNR